MTDRKTPMQRYRDVADRELLRRVAVLVRDRMAKWVFEKRTRDFAVETCNIDWMIDRVLADAPPSRSPLVYLNCACGRQKVMRDPDVMYEAGVEEGRRENAAAHARGVAEERERWMQAVTSLVGYETASAVRDDVDRVAQEVKRD